MDFFSRLGMYFFTIGAILSILAGAFPIGQGMYEVILVMLIFFGVFGAILNISEEEEIGFLIAGMAFLIAIFVFEFLLGDHPLIIALASFFEVATFFIGSMVGVVALKTVVEFGSQDVSKNPLAHADMIDEHAETLLFSKQERAWNFTVFVAVATSFIIILLDVFFNLGAYTTLIFYLDVIITIIFVIDLVVLFKKEESTKHFFKNCWLDILATIPFYNILRVAKLARLVRLSRFVKLHKTLKFFSQKSGVKHYLHGTPGSYEDQFHVATETTAKKRAPKRRKKK